MPEGCVATECRDCKFHVVISGRLDCNWQNRLGLKGSTVEQYAAIPDEEVARKRIEQKKKELEELEKSMEALKEIKKQVEEVKK